MRWMSVPPDARLLLASRAKKVMQRDATQPPLKKDVAMMVSVSADQYSQRGGVVVSWLLKKLVDLDA